MKKALPIILLAGAAILFMSMRRRPRVTVTADSPEIQSATEFEADFQETVKPKPSILETGTKIISTLFPKKTAQQKAAKKAQKAAVKSAKKSGITKKQAKAVTKSLAQGIAPFRIGASIGDDQVLC